MRICASGQNRSDYVIHWYERPGCGIKRSVKAGYRGDSLIDEIKSYYLPIYVFSKKKKSFLFLFFLIKFVTVFA